MYKVNILKNKGENIRDAKVSNSIYNGGLHILWKRQQVMHTTDYFSTTILEKSRTKTKAINQSQKSLHSASSETLLHRRVLCV